MKNLTHSCLQSIFRRLQIPYLSVIMLMLLVLPLSVKSQFNTATVDGFISNGEYGTHTDGYNQQSTAAGTWYMAWDADYLYIAYSGPRLNVSKTGVVYLNNDIYYLNDYGPSHGSYQGQLYNNTQITFIGQRSDAVIYFGFKNKILISRADGGGGWTAQQNLYGIVDFVEQTTSSFNANYEMAIPWYLLDYETPPYAPVYNPANLGHLEYVVSGTGNVAAQVPTTNPGGALGLYSSWLNNYYVNNTNNPAHYPYNNVVGWYPCYFDGTVTSAKTGLPIADADILFISGWGETYQVKTNASGYYNKIVPDNVTIPNYIIIAGYAGYNTGQVNTNNCGGTVNFQLQPQ